MGSNLQNGSICERQNQSKISTKKTGKLEIIEKRIVWENHVVKAREKFLGNSFRWADSDAKLRSPSASALKPSSASALSLPLCLGVKGQLQNQQKRPVLDLHTMNTRILLTAVEDIFVTTIIVLFERQNFICRNQKKTEIFEQFHADLVELASRADCKDREDEKFTALCITRKLPRNI